MPEIPERNCTFSVTNYGAIKVNAVRITHGVKILTTSTSTRNSRVVHPWKQTSGSCEITIKHSSRDDYISTNEWLKVYCEMIASPDNRLGTMRIQCPAARFDRLVVPSGGITFGTNFDQFVWAQKLEFKGASSPVDLRDVSAKVSYGWGSTNYVGDGSGDATSAFDLAVKGGGDLASAAGAVEDALYNTLYPRSMG